MGRGGLLDRSCVRFVYWFSSIFKESRHHTPQSSPWIMHVLGLCDLLLIYFFPIKHKHTNIETGAIYKMALPRLSLTRIILLFLVCARFESNCCMNTCLINFLVGYGQLTLKEKKKSYTK
jgi:hypothetical protein